jgi:hypothetical protein
MSRYDILTLDSIQEKYDVSGVNSATSASIFNFQLNVGH